MSLSSSSTKNGNYIDNNLTHRLVKHIISMIPKNYIIHNEDHANAHLMIYCPNIYNQAAYNTWMDSKTFRILDKSVQDIKDDMQNNTPALLQETGTTRRRKLRRFPGLQHQCKQPPSHLQLASGSMEIQQSAGSMRLRLSGYHSRKHLIRSIAYPAEIGLGQPVLHPWLRRPQAQHLTKLIVPEASAF